MCFFTNPRATDHSRLVLSHGSPRNAQDRARYGAKTLHVQAEAYAASGVAVAVPIRRGYGGNGRWVESLGGCEHPDYYNAGLAGADDIGAAVAAITKREDIDGSRVVNDREHGSRGVH